MSAIRGVVDVICYEVKWQYSDGVACRCLLLREEKLTDDDVDELTTRLETTDAELLNCEEYSKQ
jgi:hypothetical protein